MRAIHAANQVADVIKDYLNPMPSTVGEQRRLIEADHSCSLDTCSDAHWGGQVGLDFSRFRTGGILRTTIEELP